jgi:hypothetical protein
MEQFWNNIPFKLKAQFKQEGLTLVIIGRRAVGIWNEHKHLVGGQELAHTMVAHPPLGHVVSDAINKDFFIF